jgi:catechol 2,3-dioxygenase-like lactoylglutathione lyase family enzyme
MRPKVRHVAVMTKNREKMVDFYQKIFGLEPKRGFRRRDLHVLTAMSTSRCIEVKARGPKGRHQPLRL